MLIVPRTASVVAAFRAWGRRKAWTPSAIASTPVNAVAPGGERAEDKEHGHRLVRLERQVAVAATGQPLRHSTRPAAE